MQKKYKMAEMSDTKTKRRWVNTRKQKLPEFVSKRKREGEKKV